MVGAAVDPAIPVRRVFQFGKIIVAQTFQTEAAQFQCIRLRKIESESGLDFHLFGQDDAEGHRRPLRARRKIHIDSAVRHTGKLKIGFSVGNGGESVFKRTGISSRSQRIAHGNVHAAGPHRNGHGVFLFREFCAAVKLPRLAETLKNVFSGVNRKRQSESGKCKGEMFGIHGYAPFL